MGQSTSQREVNFPVLEFVILHDGGGYDDVFSRLTFPLAAPVLPIQSSFANWLAQRPRVRAMCILPDIRCDSDLGVFSELDALHNAANHNVIITSLRHGGEEVLSLRLLLCHIFVQDGRQSMSKRVIYTGRDGLYARWKRSQPTWQTFTHYDGLMVPPEAIARMKEVDDPSSKRDWDRRGVNVGQKAWTILTEWRADRTGLSVSCL